MLWDKYQTCFFGGKIADFNIRLAEYQTKHLAKNKGFWMIVKSNAILDFLTPKKSIAIKRPAEFQIQLLSGRKADSNDTLGWMRDYFLVKSITIIGIDFFA